MKLLYNDIEDLIQAWQEAYGEDFMMDGPLEETPEFVQAFKEVTGYERPEQAIDGTDDYDKVLEDYIDTISKLDIDLAQSIKDYFQDSHSEEDDEIDHFLNDNGYNG